MQNIFPLLVPTDLTNLILEFTGYHRLRSGKYMRQLNFTKTKLIKRLQNKFETRPIVKNGYVILIFSEEKSMVLYDPFVRSEYIQRL